mmetsp:Transcript_5785/g.18959  ORF Transcript_5785/g.18959 Transcript_5785/m.18959 type:complete len:235 (-) Transcript_5785:372-1076(-)
MSPTCMSTLVEQAPSISVRRITSSNVSQAVSSRTRPQKVAPPTLDAPSRRKVGRPPARRAAGTRQGRVGRRASAMPRRRPAGVDGRLRRSSPRGRPSRSRRRRRCSPLVGTRRRRIPPRRRRGRRLETLKGRRVEGSRCRGACGGGAGAGRGEGSHALGHRHLEEVGPRQLVQQEVEPREHAVDVEREVEPDADPAEGVLVLVRAGARRAHHHLPARLPHRTLCEEGGGGCHVL